MDDDTTVKHTVSDLQKAQCILETMSKSIGGGGSLVLSSINGSWWLGWVVPSGAEYSVRGCSLDEIYKKAITIISHQEGK